MKKPYIICHMMTSLDGRDNDFPLTLIKLSSAEKFESRRVPTKI